MTASKATPNSKIKNSRSIYNKKFVTPLRGAVYELAPVEILDERTPNQLDMKSEFT